MKSYWHVYGFWVVTSLCGLTLNTWLDRPTALETFFDSIFYGGAALLFHYLVAGFNKPK